MLVLQVPRPGFLHSSTLTTVPCTPCVRAAAAAALQVTRLELLDVAANPPNPGLLQAFPNISHLIIRAGDTKHSQSSSIGCC
jgi:hypothetical protein